MNSEDRERFCPICRTYHDPDFSCADRAGGILRAAGIEREPMSKGELKKTIKEADRTMLIILLVIMVAMVFFFFYS
jgi:hypothetical protein